MAKKQEEVKKPEPRDVKATAKTVRCTTKKADLRKRKKKRAPYAKVGHSAFFQAWLLTQTRAFNMASFQTSMISETAPSIPNISILSTLKPPIPPNAPDFSASPTTPNI